MQVSMFKPLPLQKKKLPQRGEISQKIYKRGPNICAVITLLTGYMFAKLLRCFFLPSGFSVLRENLFIYSWPGGLACSPSSTVVLMAEKPCSSLELHSGCSCCCCSCPPYLRQTLQQLNEVGQHQQMSSQAAAVTFCLWMISCLMRESGNNSWMFPCPLGCLEEGGETCLSGIVTTKGTHKCLLLHKRIKQDLSSIWVLYLFTLENIPLQSIRRTAFINYTRWQFQGKGRERDWVRNWLLMLRNKPHGV